MLTQGHGWLGVRRDLLLSLGRTAFAISEFSFQRDDMVYLEENSDAGHFIPALEGTGRTFSLIEHHSNLRSAIRAYGRFVLTDTEKEMLANGQRPGSGQ